MLLLCINIIIDMLATCHLCPRANQEPNKVPLSCGESISLVVGTGGAGLACDRRNLLSHMQARFTSTRAEELGMDCRSSGALVCDFGANAAKCEFWALSETDSARAIDSFELQPGTYVCLLFYSPCM
jgi:hypothetical protein